MKILDLDITDPRMRGIYSDPQVHIKVDEYVDEIGEPVYDHIKSYSMRLIPCGPFWAPEFRPDSALVFWFDLDEVMKYPDHKDFKRGKFNDDELPDYGYLNKINLIPNQLFPVEVHSPGDSLSLAMEVPRLRRLIRKYDLGFQYQLQVDEDAAIRGLLKWRIESVIPVCYGGSMPYQDRCIAEPIQTIVYKNTHLPLCRQHLEQHRERFRRARLTTSGN